MSRVRDGQCHPTGPAIGKSLPPVDGRVTELCGSAVSNGSLGPQQNHLLDGVAYRMAEALHTHGPSFPRIIAVVLALGAAFWGGLLFLVFGPLVLVPFTPFGVGYVVLAGYITRAVSCPSLGVRRMIWIVSILVQGVWLCLVLAEGLGRAIEKPIPPLWWACATLGSAVALVNERNDAEADTAPDPARMTAFTDS